MLVVAHLMWYAIVLFAILFFLFGVLLTIYASRIANWFLQTFLTAGRKFGDEKMLISGYGPFAKAGFLTWWVRIEGILLSAFSLYISYMLLSNLI